MQTFNKSAFEVDDVKKKILKNRADKMGIPWNDSAYNANLMANMEKHTPFGLEDIKQTILEMRADGMYHDAHVRSITKINQKINEVAQTRQPQQMRFGGNVITVNPAYHVSPELLALIGSNDVNEPFGTYLARHRGLAPSDFENDDFVDNI